MAAAAILGIRKLYMLVTHRDISVNVKTSFYVVRETLKFNMVVAAILSFFC